MTQRVSIWGGGGLGGGGGRGREGSAESGGGAGVGHALDAVDEALKAWGARG